MAFYIDLARAGRLGWAHLGVTCTTWCTLHRLWNGGTRTKDAPCAATRMPSVIDSRKAKSTAGSTAAEEPAEAPQHARALAGLGVHHLPRRRQPGQGLAHPRCPGLVCFSFTELFFEPNRTRPATRYQCASGPFDPPWCPFWSFSVSVTSAQQLKVWSPKQKTSRAYTSAQQERKMAKKR